MPPLLLLLQYVRAQRQQVCQRLQGQQEQAGWIRPAGGASWGVI
jgi:hypothetical protein